MAFAYYNLGVLVAELLRKFQYFKKIYGYIALTNRIGGTILSEIQEFRYKALLKRRTLWLR